jgi:hypothetical protein
MRIKLLFEQRIDLTIESKPWNARLRHTCDSVNPKAAWTLVELIQL